MLSRPSIAAYLLPACLYALAACTARPPLSDAEALALRGPVNAVSEDFFLASNSFDRVVAEKLLYRRSYCFDQGGRFIEVVREDMLHRRRPVPVTADSAATADSAGTACPKADSAAADEGPGGLAARDAVNTDVEPDVEYDSCGIPAKSIVPLANNEEPRYGAGEEPYALERYVYTSDSVCIVNVFDRDNRLIAYEEQWYVGDRLSRTHRYAAPWDLLLTKTSFRYDARGRLASRTTYYERNYYEVAYRYGWWKWHESFNYNFINYEYCFDLRGRISRKRKYNGKIPLALTTYEYNDRGDVLVERESDEGNGAERETRYQYRYDAYGNWTECVERRFDGNVFLRKRTVTYYEQPSKPSDPLGTNGQQRPGPEEVDILKERAAGPL